MTRYEQGKRVTPAQAKRWLARNAENNRNEKTSKIPGYARDMISGNWLADTGESLKFDPDGVLIDGQNRLQAVIMAGVPVVFDIAWDVPRNAMHVLDTGASRTAADALKIAGASDRMRSASIVRWAIMWDAKIFTGKGGSVNPTTTEVLSRYQSETGRFNSAAARASDCQVRGLGTGSPAGMAHYLFSVIDAEETHQFFDQYISGANLPDKSGVLALRNRMARLKVDRLTRPEQLALFIRAWNAVREGRPTERLQIMRAGDLTNLNFPQPI